MRGSGTVVLLAMLGAAAAPGPAPRQDAWRIVGPGGGADVEGSGFGRDP